MDTFERAGKRERIIDVAATSFGCRETKNRSQPFATGKKAVTHRLVKCCRLGIRLGQEPVQGAIDQLLASDEIRFEIHVGKTNTGLLGFSILVIQSLAKCPVSSIRTLRRNKTQSQGSRTF